MESEEAKGGNPHTIEWNQEKFDNLVFAYNNAVNESADEFNYLGCILHTDYANILIAHLSKKYKK